MQLLGRITNRAKPNYKWNYLHVLRFFRYPKWYHKFYCGRKSLFETKYARFSQGSVEWVTQNSHISGTLLLSIHLMLTSENSLSKHGYPLAWWHYQHRQALGSQDVEYVDLTDPSHWEGRIPTICTIPVLNNDIKYEYFFIFCGSSFTRQWLNQHINSIKQVWKKSRMFTIGELGYSNSLLHIN